MIKWGTIQLINAIAQNEEKLKIPMKINILHLIAAGNSPNMEKGTMTPTKIDKAKVTLKDPKSPFALFTLGILFYLHTLLCNASNMEFGVIDSHLSGESSRSKTSPFLE